MSKVKAIPTVSAQEMRLIDHELTTRYGIDLPIMMENAGKSLGLLAKRMLKNSVQGRRIACLIGKGNNGGGGLVAARHLHNWGARVNCILALSKEEMKEAPAKQLEILEKMRVEVGRWSGGIHLEAYDLLLDALIGYNLKGNPEPPFSEIISASNASGTPILTLDMPSGLNATTGQAYIPCIVGMGVATHGSIAGLEYLPLDRQDPDKVLLGAVQRAIEWTAKKTPVTRRASG